MEPESPRSHRSQLLEAAADIAHRLSAQAIALPDGGVTWDTSNDPDETSPELMDPDLYGGPAGIALFLAAFDAIAGDSRYRDLALRAIAGTRRRLAAGDSRAGRIGGLVGLGSAIYAFVTLARLLEEPRLVEEAHAASALLTVERIAGDRQYDLLLGSAGAILALLALDRVAPGPNATGLSPLELASRCGRHLLVHRVSHQGGPRAWAPPGQSPRSGLAHGAAGIAVALLRLGERTGDAELLPAALEGIAHEGTLFDPERGNWRDQPSQSHATSRAWCYGAPGIALGRLATLDLLDSPGIREEIAIALTSTRKLSLSANDHLCCGNMGRVEILLEACRRLGDIGLLQTAVSLAIGTLGRARERGGFRLPPDDEGGNAASFFKGAAGIGYALLRLVEPEALPCVLILS